MASNYAYTRRYDNVIKELPRKVKIVDDIFLYDHNIEELFFHTWDYLSLCATNGIVINEAKFKFCQDIVKFKGLQIPPSGITPSNKLLSAIKNLPTLINIPDTR